MQLRKVDLFNNKKDLRAFVDLPWDLYKDDKNWVPPLKLAVEDLLKKDHPFYNRAELKAWIVSIDGVDVGRIAGIINHAYIEYHDKKIGFFGFFECINNKDVSKLLFQAVEKYILENDLTSIQGPVNPSTNYECGTLVKGFDDPPQIMMTYNPSYHESIINDSGYKKAIDLLAYTLPDLDDYHLPPIINRIADRVEKNSRIVCRPVNKKNWDEEIKTIHKIYNEAWQKNAGFIPMTLEEFYKMGKDLKPVISKDLIFFTECDGEAVGFFLALPDYHQVLHQIPTGKLLPFGIFKLLRPKKYINRFRVLTLGITPKFRKKGLETLLYRSAWERLIASKVGYNSCEMSWILEENKEMNRPLQIMNATAYKTYRIFEKEISK